MSATQPTASGLNPGRTIPVVVSAHAALAWLMVPPRRGGAPLLLSSVSTRA